MGQYRESEREREIQMDRKINYDFSSLTQTIVNYEKCQTKRSKHGVCSSFHTKHGLLSAIRWFVTSTSVLLGSVCPGCYDDYNNVQYSTSCTCNK